MTIHDRIKEARLRKGYSMQELGDEVGVTAQSVNQWENGGNPRAGKIAQIAKALSVSPEWLQFGIETVQINHNHGTQTNFTGQSQTNTVNNNFFSNENKNSGSLKKIVMPDNAMLPTFPQGSELTIDTSQTAIIDGKIYQIQSGERFFIRKIFSQISGSLKIVCDNPEFESVIVSSDSVQIVGRVIEWRVRD